MKNNILMAMLVTGYVAVDAQDRIPLRKAELKSMIPGKT